MTDIPKSATLNKTLEGHIKEGPLKGRSFKAEYWTGDQNGNRTVGIEAYREGLYMGTWTFSLKRKGEAAEAVSMFAPQLGQTRYPSRS